MRHALRTSILAPFAAHDVSRPGHSMRRHTATAWLAALLATAACSAGDAPAPDAESPDVGDAGADAAPARLCAPPPGVSGRPNTIAQAVELINALPSPVTLPCFIDALERPLRLSATTGTISAQPAVGERSPRFFIVYGGLIMSFALDGFGHDLLEFGELVTPTRSRKGELAFPVVTPLAPEAPYTKVLFQERTDRTSCALCHGAEEPDPAITFTQAYVSEALRPMPTEVVSIPSMRAERDVCDHDAEPSRCAMLDALFARDDLVIYDFPTNMETIFD